MSEHEAPYEGSTADRELILVGMTPEDICEGESIIWVSLVSWRNVLATT
jgi:hypothetical protein